MKEVIEKIGTYNIFNYLFPGAVFSFLMNIFLKINIMQKDLIIALFLYYFIGLVISRVGSVVIEPALKKIKFIEFADYKKFIEASKVDGKIEVLSEANNMYRTLISLFFLLLLSKIFVFISNKCAILKNNSLIILVLGLMFLFLFAYKKQTNYITKRVNK